MIAGVVLAIAGVGVLAALMFNAAIYALPVVVGIWVLQQALQNGAGSVSAIGLGIVAGALTYALGHHVFENHRFERLRLVVAVAFIVPAVFAGYSLSLVLLRIGLAPSIWSYMLAGFGGIAVGATTFARLVANSTDTAI
jgi:hypothetical protein